MLARVVRGSVFARSVRLFSSSSACFGKALVFDENGSPERVLKYLQILFLP